MVCLVGDVQEAMAMVTVRVAIPMLQWQLIPLSAMDSNPHMQKLIIIVAALYTGQICSVASSLLEWSRKLARHAALSLYTSLLPVVVFCRCVNAIPDRSVLFLGH